MDPRIKELTTILIISVLARSTHGIIGYDCGSASANLTTLSLISIEECDIPPQKVNSVYVQLLQINEFKSVKVIQCKVEINRSIKKCGMFSHAMDVYNGKFSYIEEISKEACQRMHVYGTYEIAGTHIVQLKSNQSVSRPITLAGHVENDGTCSGSAYSDPYGTWTDVVVLASIKITLQDYVANVRANLNRVHLRSGVACDLTATHCVDIEGGDTFWEPIPADFCKFSDYSILYNGYVDKIYDYVNDESQIVYSIRTQSTTFALTTTGQYMTCGHTLVKTEHPKLVIFETTSTASPFTTNGHLANLDIFTYMNSKFVYVEKHIRSQISQLYRNILLQQCNLELRTIQNALAIATRSPDIFAYHFMKGPGYMALLAGEVIHIVKCVPIEVKIAQTTDCYEQLPVLRGNKTYFLTPQTHILLRQGTQIACNSFAPTMYLLEDSWYKFMPRPVETLPPTIMKPSTKPTWKYISPGALATSGIYSQSDLDDLKDHIMFPAERPALLNTIARGIMGQSTTLHGGSLSNLMDEASITRIATSAWEKFWSKFLIFGNISAGILGVYLLGRIVKFLLDTLVHGYTLHMIYGWSLYLIGAIWDSVTQLLLLLGRGEGRQKSLPPSAPAGTELQETRPPETSERERTYPLLPAQERSNYTFELRN